MSADSIGMDVLATRYRPMLALVRELIGVVPNCDTYLEIWPPGFRTYNLLVPNFLNLPAGLLGRGVPKELVGLGMYVSSRAADCSYCSAHTCSFALRRGATSHAVTGEARTGVEQAVAGLAEAMGTVPAGDVTAARAALDAYLQPKEVEAVALGIAMMGFLNKFMDALGVDLEPEAIQDVQELISPTGWSVKQHGWADPTIDPHAAPPRIDSLGTYWRVLRQIPAAIKLERTWTRDLPDNEVLQSSIARSFGVDEPALSQLRSQRPARALAAMFRENLCPAQSKVGIARKALAAATYADAVGSDRRRSRAVSLAEFAANAKTDLADDREAKDEATIALARSISPSPATVTPDVVQAVSAVLSPPEIVELTVWLSLQQLLHRLDLYFDY